MIFSFIKLKAITIYIKVGMVRVRLRSYRDSLRLF